MPHHFNIETFRDGCSSPPQDLNINDHMKKVSYEANDTFVFTGLTYQLTALDLLLKRPDNRKFRPHYVAMIESLQLLSYRLLFELPEELQNNHTCNEDVANPVILATWYLYRLNAFRGTKIPMVRVGDHARLFFGQFIINILPLDCKKSEMEVRNLIDQTKWKYLSPRIISIFVEDSPKGA